MKSIEKKIEDVAINQKIGLWRSHPSFFYVSLFFTFESLMIFWIFFFYPTQVESYQNLFQILPQLLFSLFYLAGGAIVTGALISRYHVFLRVGALLLLIPNMMMVSNFILLAASGGIPALYIAASKWTLTCLMLILMMREPFVNPSSAR